MIYYIFHINTAGNKMSFKYQILHITLLLYFNHKHNNLLFKINNYHKYYNSHSNNKNSNYLHFFNKTLLLRWLFESTIFVQTCTKDLIMLLQTTLWGSGEEELHRKRYQQITKLQKTHYITLIENVKFWLLLLLCFTV